MQFNCPKCQTLLSSTPELAGQVVSCPSCSTKLRMPTPKKASPVSPTPVTPVSRPVPIQPKPPQQLPTPSQAPVYQAQAAPTTAQNPYRKRPAKSGNGKIWLLVAGACLMFLLIGGGLATLMYVMAYNSSRKELEVDVKTPLITQTPIDDSNLGNPTIADSTSPSSTAETSSPGNAPTGNRGYDATNGTLGELAYTVQLGRPLHYEYEVITQIESVQVPWTGKITLRADDTMQIRPLERRHEPNLGIQGKGLAIAPNLVITGLELVTDVESITVSQRGRTSSATQVGTVSVERLPEIGLAILRTESSVSDQPFFQPRTIDAKKFPIKTPLLIVYRDGNGLVQTERVEITGFRSTRSRENVHSYYHILTSLNGKEQQIPNGALVLTENGESAGVLAHVKDKNFTSSLIVPMSELDRMNAFESSSLSRPAVSAELESTEPAELQRRLAPSMVDIKVRRKQTEEDQIARSLPSQTLRFTDRRKSPPQLGTRRRNLGYMGSNEGDYRLLADGTTFSGNAKLLPLALGTPCNLVMPPLDPSTSKAWSISYPVATIESDEGSRRDALSHFRRPRLKTAAAGTLTRKFHVSRRSGSIVFIQEKFDLNTTVGLTMVGTANYEFDTTQRCMRSGRFTGNLVLESERVTLRLPVRYSFRRLTDKEMEPVFASERKRAETRQRVRAETNAKEQYVFSEEDLQQILAGLSGSKGDQMNARNRLSQSKTQQQDARISAKLRDMAIADTSLHIMSLQQVSNRWMSEKDITLLAENLSGLSKYQKGFVYKLARHRKLDSVAGYIISDTLEESATDALFYLNELNESREIERLILSELKSIFSTKKNRSSDKVTTLIKVLGRRHGGQDSLEWLKEISEAKLAPQPFTSLAIRSIESKVR